MRKQLMIAAGIVAALAVVAAACSNNAPSGGGTGGTTGGASASPSVTTLDPGVLTVGSCLAYPPFESVKNGKEIGFDIEMTDSIAAKLGLQVKWVKANFNTIFTAVAGHQFDMVAAAVTATGKTGSQRAQTVAFSDYYYDSRQSLTVNVQATPDITSTDQLGSGDVVGAQKGTTGLAWAEDNLAPKGVQIKTYTEAPDAFRDLQAGRIQGVINDEPASAVIVNQFPDTKVVEAIDTNEKYAFAFAKDTPDLVTAWNQALTEIIQDGTYGKIYAKWFPGAPVPPEFQPS